MLAALYDSVTQNEIKIIPDNSSGLQIDRIKTLSLSFTRFFFLYHLRGGGALNTSNVLVSNFFFFIGVMWGWKKIKRGGCKSSAMGTRHESVRPKRSVWFVGTTWAWSSDVCSVVGFCHPYPVLSVEVDWRWQDVQTHQRGFFFQKI